MKKGLLLLSALFLVFGIVACKQVTTTVPTTTTTESIATTTTTAFSISLSGLTDAGFEEPKIYTNQLFDLMEGVHAFGSDGVDYADRILVQADDDACQIDDDNYLMSTGAKTCIVTYTVVVNSRMARETRNIKITAAPVTIEFTETDKWNNETIFGTDYTVEAKATAAAVANQWYYWTDISQGVSASVQNDQLWIDQEAIGGNWYSFQVKLMTNIAVEAKRTYKLTFTVDSEVDRMIAIVVKAMNADDGYDRDTRSDIELMAGVHDYEVVFVAPQDVLHLNIVTGSVELEETFGLLKFSNFTLWEGPIVVEYEELTDFFKNDSIANGTEIDYIGDGETDSDYARTFYYWDQEEGALLQGEYIDGGFQFELLAQATNDWGVQLQWNDLAQTGTQLKKGAKYKLTLTVNAPVARTMKIEITGSTNSQTKSGEQTYSLEAGNNEIVLEFTSLYNAIFIKFVLGNFGDLVHTGVFTIANMKLFEEKGAVEEPEEPEEPTVIGNLFTVANVDLAALGTDQIKNNFYLWNGEGSVLTSQYNAGEVIVDATNLGTQFWAIQMKYSGSDLIIGAAYDVYFEVYSEVAREINVQIKNSGYNSVFAEKNYQLVAGLNRIMLSFVDENGSFNMQLNLGQYGTTEVGELRFSNFLLVPATVEIVDYFANGDFDDTVALGATDGDGWAAWKTTGVTWLNDDLEYLGTETIADGKLTVETTRKGHEVWALQIQYNMPDADLRDLLVGEYYRIELDVNANIATTVVFQLKAAEDKDNLEISYDLVAGDNHVVLYYPAVQARFRFFVLLGFQEAGTILSFDNFRYFAHQVPSGLIESGNRFGTPVNADASPITTDKGDRYEFYVWAANWNATAWSGTFTDGEVTIDVNNAGDAFWNVQLIYRGGKLTVGHDYVISFTVDAEVARTINIQLKDAAGNGTYYDHNIDLVAGVNVIELEFTAGLPVFNMQLNLGSFSSDPLVVEEGLLTFSDFLVVRPLELVEDFFANGDFADAVALGGADADGWAAWKTTGASWLVDDLEYIGTEVVADGKLTVETTKKGHEVWALQIQYNQPVAQANMVVGEWYQIELDVNSNVATTVVFELKGVTDDKNIDVPVELIAGDNHVVLNYFASQPRFRFFILLGLQEVGTILSFDNLVYYQPYFPTAGDLPIGNIFPVENADEALPFDTVIQDTFTIWYGLPAWNMGWSVYPELTATYADSAVSIDILNTGSPASGAAIDSAFWSIQLKYKGGALAVDTAYRLTFTVNAEVARTINVEIKNNAFGGVNQSFPINLVVGVNHITIDFTAAEPSFGLQINLGQISDVTVEEGLFVFTDFMLTRPTFEWAGYIDNGDFATDAVFAPETADGWAFFKTTGVDWLADELEDIGTETITGGVMTISTTKQGHEIWALQIQYNHPTAELIVGALYRVEFDVNSNVATSFVLQMKHDSNANYEVTINLVAGDNHVVVFMPAVQDRFRLDLCMGKLPADTVLVFDNFQLFAPANEFPAE